MSGLHMYLASLPALNDLDAAEGPRSTTLVPRHNDKGAPPPQTPRASRCWFCRCDLPTSLTTIDERCCASTERVLVLGVLAPGRHNGGARSALVHPERPAAELNMLPWLCAWLRGLTAHGRAG